MIINFEKKLTSNLLDSLIKFYEGTTQIIDKKEIITFNLKEIEWIAIEELTFLFAWFRHLLSLNHKIYIVLPDYFNSSDRNRERLISLYARWNIDSFVPVNINKGYRETDLYLNINSSLVNILKEEEKKRGRYLDPHWHKIIPFTSFNANYNIKLGNLKEVLKGELYPIFKLEKQIEDLLNIETAFSSFDNKTLSHIITTELFLNVVQHAFSPNYAGEKKCYLSIVLNNKRDVFQYAKQNNLTFKDSEDKINFILSQNFKTERTQEEIPFFIDKLSNRIRNESFIEFTFIDFGEGIPNTLREKYSEDVKNPNVFNQLSKQKKYINEDSKVLEYSFLLHSSRNPFEENIKIQDYVPRGLYFILDMIKRYSGMLILRSNYGKIVYDFSNENKKINECIRFAENDSQLTFFQGTMISMVLPAKAPKNINAVQKEKSDNSSIKTTEVPYKYLKVMDGLMGFSGDRINDVYHSFFRWLNEELEQLSQEPCIILIDFAGTPEQIIDHKIYYYLCNTPFINEHSRAIICNPPNISTLKQTQLNIINADVHLFRPIPCILNTNGNEDVFWIGLRHEKDSEKLTELWRFIENQESIAVTDLTDINYLMGNMIHLKDKHGNVTLTIPQLNEVRNHVNTK